MATSTLAPDTSYPPLETPTTPAIAAPYHLIDTSDFSLDFKLDAPIPPGRYIVAVEESYARETETQFKVISFTGEVVSTLDVKFMNDGISYPDFFSITQIHFDSNQLLIGVVDEGSTKELYKFDLQTTKVWAISLGCETAAGTAVNALGRNYLAFRCWDETHTWHFVNTSDPAESYTITVPIAEDPFEYYPIWVGTDQIFFRGENQAFCLGSIPDWDPLCENILYRPGRFTTDVGLLEILEGRPENPTAIGALSIVCLRSDQPSCDPILIEDPFSNLQQPWRLHSSWVPGTSSILYLKLVDHDPSTFVFDETELWLAVYPERNLIRLDALEGEVFLTELEFPDTPVSWLDNGKELILNKLDDLIVYNIETGEQRSIGYHGKVLGTITIE